MYGIDDGYKPVPNDMMVEYGRRYRENVAACERLLKERYPMKVDDYEWIRRNVWQQVQSEIEFCESGENGSRARSRV